MSWRDFLTKKENKRIDELNAILADCFERDKLATKEFKALTALAEFRQAQKEAQE